MNREEQRSCISIILLLLLIECTFAYINSYSTPSQRSSTARASVGCPAQCECERASSTHNNDDKESLSIYCYRGGLNDSDFLHILQIIPKPQMVQMLEIKAPANRPNSFQWNDNLNRFSHLKKLVLSNCGIPALSQSIYLPFLLHLDLSHNRIDQLQIGSFIGLPSLESLHISSNQIHILSTGAFLYLKNLKILSLSHNQLKELPASLLRGPSALQELELDGNQLSAKQFNELFTDLFHLTRLEINDCGLNDTQVEELQLARIPSLTRLGIASNNLTAVPSTTIRALEHLQTLNLRHNSIKTLVPCAFCACNLSTVLLGNNLLGLTPASLHPEAFADTHITELDLSFNFFDQFDSKMLENAQETLKVLSLSGNSLNNFYARLIHSLPKLTHLHMAANKISHIPFSLPRGYAYLKFLNLSFNHLDELPSNLAGSLPKLQVLDLSHNKFESLSTTVMTGFVEGLQQVYLHNNPWDCQCAVQNLQQYMLQRLSYRELLGYETTVCAKPPLLKGRPLHRVQKINDCAVLFGASYGLTQASELLLLLAALLVAAFLVSVIVIIMLYCGREHKQKTVYVTREHSRTQLTTHPLDIASAGGSTSSGAPSSLTSDPHLTSPTSLLLHNGTTERQKGKKNAGVHSSLLDSRDDDFRSRRQKSPPPPGSMFVTF